MERFDGPQDSEIVPPTIRSKLNQANHLQRRFGNRPSGNSRSKNTIGPPAETQTQHIIHAAALLAGSEPGTASRVYMAYSALKCVTPHIKPIRQNSQPIGFLGEMRGTMSAPTSEQPTASRVFIV